MEFARYKILWAEAYCFLHLETNTLKNKKSFIDNTLDMMLACFTRDFSWSSKDYVPMPYPGYAQGVRRGGCNHTRGREALLPALLLVVF